MNSQTPVINISGDFEETVLRMAKHLGRDKNRRAVFRLIYGRGSKPRSKKQIAEALGVEGTAQVVQNSLDHLAKHRLIVRLENDGHVADGSRVVYAKDRSVGANKGLIEKYADDPGAAKEVATKRRPAMPAFSLVKPSVRPATRSRSTRRPVRTAARLRIALLVTNPESRASLQTMVEGRDIEKALEPANASGQVDLKVLLAPTFETLLDMLNEYRPTVIHFSGHGGGATLLFDNDRVGDDGGTVLDFDMVARVIAATSAQPSLLVLAACDTVDGADRFLGEVPAVIAMAAPIDDDAAAEFSPRLYRSLASGQTIANSLQQAKLLLEQKGYVDASLPTLLTRDEADGQRILI